MLEVVSNTIGLVTAFVSLFGVYIQQRLSSQEQSSFRQQLISVLHHAEGITDSLSSIENSVNKDENPTLRAALEAIRKNAATLQMGLMETKVGGKQLSDDLDKSYKEWAELELKLRMLPLKQFISGKEAELKSDLK